MRRGYITAVTLGMAALTLSGCAQDKQMHFAAGAATSGVVRYFTDSPLASCGAAMGLGIAKEVYDSMGHGNVEAMDALATAAGCLTWEIKF